MLDAGERQEEEDKKEEEETTNEDYMLFPYSILGFPQKIRISLELLITFLFVL